MKLSPVRTGFPLELRKDASATGLGFILTQRTNDSEEDNGQRNIIKVGSTGLSPTQSRYSTIQQELLAVVWGCQKCHYYIAGAPSLTIITDNNSLVGMMQRGYKTWQKS